jgi:hypothetical protein
VSENSSGASGNDTPESFGPYRIEGLVRHRSELSTFRARHTELGRPVWLTTSPPSAGPNPALDDRLRRSAELLAAIGFETVLGLIEVIEVGDRVAIITEAPAGESLRSLIDRHAEQPPAAMDALALALARAVAGLHRHGVMHLALSPEDAFLGSDGRVKLASLWDARKLGDTSESRDMPEAGPHERYASPERMARAIVDRKSDVFSLGVMGYELVTGAHPFDSDEGEASLVRRLRTEEAAPIEGRALLSQTLQKALHKLPTLRYETAERMADDLELALEEGRLLERETELQAGNVFTRSPRLARQLGIVLGLMVVVVLAAWAVDRSDLGERSYPAGAASGNVRVLARPWADVLVDGTQVDTTPIGRPLRLPPGKHEITFRHPRAPEQRRMVDLAPGATITLDIQMDIQKPVEIGPDGSP